ncbi:integrase core domain-containing protein [Streptomyces anulatus]|uniref:integrase core domain-containing protein n=1 Tax=Streptomyces anulatus TaxID=1892 RepID=UPI003659BCB7
MQSAPTLETGATTSVGSVADSYDNAMAEALNGSSKADLIEHQGPWRDAEQVELAVVQWVGWYNTQRLHSALDYLPPEEFEAQRYRCDHPLRVRRQRTSVSLYVTGNRILPQPRRCAPPPRLRA